MWITNGPDCHVLVVYAKTDSSHGWAKGMTAFILDYGPPPAFPVAKSSDTRHARLANNRPSWYSTTLKSGENILGGLGRRHQGA